LDEFEGGEIFDLVGVQAGLEREGELVQGFVVWQSGKFQRVAEPASFPQSDFFLYSRSTKSR
jgi:hypothetical protein